MTRLSIFLTRIMTHSNHLNRILIFLNEYDTFKSYDSSFDISQGIGHSQIIFFFYEQTEKLHFKVNKPIVS